MKSRKEIFRASRFISSICLATLALSFGMSVVAQEQQPVGPDGLTMTLFPVGKDAAGERFITTKAGFKVTIPGVNLAPDANEIAVNRNNQNKFWYVDQTGATKPVSDSQLQWTMAQINNQQAMRNIEIQKTEGMAPSMQSAMVPAMMPGQVPVTQAAPTVIVQNQQPTNSGGAATTAMVSGLAAATGAMAGSAISSSIYNSSYHGMPYGAPMYHANGHYYYNGADGAHEVPMHTDNPYMNQWSRQEAYQNNSENRHDAYNNLNGNQQQMLKNEGKERMDQPGGFRGLGRAGGLGGGRFRR